MDVQAVLAAWSKKGGYILNNIFSMLRQLYSSHRTEQIDDLVLDFNQHLDLDKQQFLSLVDMSKKHVFKAFARKYSAPYAKLLTLKTLNLIVGKYHYVNNHSTVASRPIQLMIDPSNACQLSCPGCVHTSNPVWAKETAIHWPKGMLSLENYEKILQIYGPLAFGTILYNYGEPLLNPLTPRFISLAKKYLLFTLLSSNLSLPAIDAEAIVKSGLNRLIISLDGVTQDIYEQYRKGGKLNLVLDNIRNLVNTKKKLGIKTPYLEWQFLTFEHNVHQVEQALALASDIGVDAIHIQTPNEVSLDDPTIRITHSPHEGYHLFTPWESTVDFLGESSSDLITSKEIDDFLMESLVERMGKIGNVDEISGKGAPNCKWLYGNITVDGLGRILPCCIPPSDDRELIYGQLQNDSITYWNSNHFKESRVMFSGRTKPDQEESTNSNFCRICPAVPDLPNGLWLIAKDLGVLDNSGIFSENVHKWLTDWG